MTIDEQKLREILGQELDSRFAAYDTKLDARFDAFEVKLDTKLELKFAQAFGQMSRLLDKKLNDAIKPLSDRIDQMYNTLDGFVARMDNDDSERAAMNNDLNRHSRWIGELAKHTGTTLSAP